MKIVLQMDQTNCRLVDQHTIYSHFKQESLKSTCLIPLQWMFAECFYSSLIVNGIFLGFGLVVRQTSCFKTSYLDITDVHTDVRKTAATQEESDATI